MIDMHDYPPAARTYWWVLFIVGVGLVAWAVIGSYQSSGLGTVGLVATLALGSGIVALFPVEVRGTQTSFTVGDFPAFLGLALLGPNAAIAAAATEGLVAAARGSSRWTSRLGSPAMCAIAMAGAAAAAQGLEHFIGKSAGLLLPAMLVAGLVCYLVAVALNAALIAFKRGRMEMAFKFLKSSGWMGASYVSNALIAGLLAVAFRRYEWMALAFAIPLLMMSLVTLHAMQRRRAADERAEGLLLNMFPASIVEEYKTTGRVKAKRHDDVTVLFSDFADFTNLAATMPAQALVAELDDIFGQFDEIVMRHGLEKIKTVGDAYIAIAGLEKDADHAARCARAALEIRDWLATRNGASPLKWNIRIGLHSGGVITGVVGKTRFGYDVWGDAVNTAARIQSQSATGRVNVSAFTASLLGNAFALEHRGKLEAKGKGALDMYFIEARGLARVVPYEKRVPAAR